MAVLTRLPKKLVYIPMLHKCIRLFILRIALEKITSEQTCVGFCPPFPTVYTTKARPAPISKTIESQG